MNVPGKRVRLFKWIYGGSFVARVEVEGIVPDADPSEPCLEPNSVKWLDELQRMANEGRVEELARHGEVFVRRAG